METLGDVELRGSGTIPLLPRKEHRALPFPALPRASIKLHNLGEGLCREMPSSTSGKAGLSFTSSLSLRVGVVWPGLGSLGHQELLQISPHEPLISLGLAQTFPASGSK